MGVDTRAVCMIGKYFENFDAALGFLQEAGYLTEEQGEDAKYDGDLPDSVPVIYQNVSCYSEEGGYLGLEVPQSLNLTSMQGVIDTVKSVVGDDIGIHNFVYWY
jgi:hypothetical protein